MTISAIIKSIQNNEITEVSLEGLTPTSEECNELVAVLKKNNTVTNLQIWYCQFKNIQDAVNLIEIFRYNNSIKKFGISGHYIAYGDLVMNAVADVLKHNCILTSVNLYYLNATNSAIEAIAESLKLNKTLEKICLEFSACEERGLRKLAEAVSVNSTIRISYGSTKPESQRALEIYNKIIQPWVSEPKPKNVAPLQNQQTEISNEYKSDAGMRPSPA